MASGAVRELITKVKFRVDNNSLNATNNAIKQIKQKLNQLGQSRIKINVRVDSAAINNALSQIRNQMAHLNLNIHAQASVATIRATTVNLYGRINNRGGGGGMAVAVAVAVVVMAVAKEMLLLITQALLRQQVRLWLRRWLSP